MKVHVKQGLFRCRDLYADLFSHKTKNEIQELLDLLNFRCYDIDMFQRNEIFIDFLKSVCYKYTGDEKKRELLMDGMSNQIVSYLNASHVNEVLDHAQFLLMLEIFENSEKWKNLHYQIYERFVLIKIKLIDRESKETRRQFVDNRPNTKSYPLCSCNVALAKNLDRIFNLIQPEVEYYDCLEHMLTSVISTTADRIYFSQFLLFSGKREHAIPLLKATVEQEGDFSTSVVIWPKQLYETFLIDDVLRQELIKSSKDYVVFPANLYARYLLSIAYYKLGQEDNLNHNLYELIVLRERYKRIREFAPMVKIMFTVS